MNKLKRVIRTLTGILAAALLAALPLTGCGSKAPQTDPAAEPQADDGTLSAVFFDVGKGDCILISGSGQYLLIDAGYEDTAPYILKELGSRGVDKLDAMVITHYDKDHVGGAALIADRIPITTIYLPDYEGDADKSGDLMSLISRKGLNAVRVTDDEEFALGQAQVRINDALVDYDPVEKNDNDASLIVEIHNGEDEWLLPGDIEKDAIGVWLEENGETYDILKLPHHGKKEKNTKDLIETVDPQIAVVTDSSDEEANQKVLDRLEKNDVQVYRSSESGTITITGNGKEDYQVSSEK